MRGKSAKVCSVLAVAFSLVLSGCGKKEEAKDSAVKLKYMFWGTIQEKNAIMEMKRNFETKYQGIDVQLIHVSADSYNAKMATLVASNNTPDIAALEESQVFDFAVNGQLKDLSSLYENDKNYDPETVFDKCKYYLDDKLIGLSTAVETIQLFYNKELFEKQGLPLPPSKAEEAWTWDEFVKVAKQLTLDTNGKHPDDPGFNPKSIKQYGVAFGTDFLSYMPMVWSNGGDIATPDGKQNLIGSPEFIEAIEKISDLINKYHVSPNPAQKKAMPGIDIILLTKHVAMAVGGQWSLLDLTASKVPFGIGVLPKMKKPVTMVVGAPTVIFNSTKYPDEAWNFYKNHNSIEMAPNLFQKGLWMPVQKAYYTDPELMKLWIDNPEHPKEYRSAVIDYFLNNTIPSPTYSLKNWGKIEETLRAALDNVWLGNKPAREILPELSVKIQPLFQGRYSNKSIVGLVPTETGK